MYRCLLLAVIVCTQACAASNWGNFGASQLPSNVVTARKFVLVDANSQPIAELGAAPGGNGLVLLDSAGKPHAALIVTQAGEPGLKLYDRTGTVRAALVVANDGRSGLAFYDALGKNRAALTINPDGAPALLFFDPNGRVMTLLPASSHQHGRAGSG